VKRINAFRLRASYFTRLTNKVCQGDLEAKPTLLKHLQDIEQSATASEVLRETVRVCRLRLE
ncbi:MAG: hypothetical protein AAFU75_07530, partial [Planctomycetota bacterium]